MRLRGGRFDPEAEREFLQSEPVAQVHGTVGTVQGKALAAPAVGEADAAAQPAVMRGHFVIGVGFTAPPRDQPGGQIVGGLGPENA